MSKLKYFDKSFFNKLFLAIITISFFIIFFTSMRVLKYCLQTIVITLIPLYLLCYWIRFIINLKSIYKKIITAISSVIIVGVFSVYLYYFFTTLLPMYRDIPYALTSNYSSIKGYPTGIEETIGRGSQIKFDINDTSFIVESKDVRMLMDEEKQYTFKYLPNTKYLISIE